MKMNGDGCWGSVQDENINHSEYPVFSKVTNRLQ